MLATLSSFAVTTIVLLGTILIGRVGFGLQAQLEGYSLSEQTLNQDNPAVTLRWVGMMVALVIAVLGVYQPNSGDVGMAFASGVMAFCLAFVALVLSRYVNDRVILHMVDNNKAVVQEKNLAVAIVEFSTYCATGAIFAGGISSPGHSLLAAIAWFVVGQAILVGLAYGYYRLFPQIYDEITKGNEACALSLAGVLLSGGIVVGALIHGKPDNIVIDLIRLGFGLAVWVAIMIATRLAFYAGFVSRERFTSELVTDRNWSIGLVDGIVFLAVTVAFVYLN